MSLQLEIGKSYRSKNDYLVTIASEVPRHVWEPIRFKGTNHCVYSVDGQLVGNPWCNDNKDLEDRLVKEIVTDDDKQGLRYPIFLSNEQSVGYVFENLRQWGEQVFGPVKPSRIVERSDEEMTELKEAIAGDVWTDKALEEAADIVVILTRAPGLWEAIEKKMAINAERKWNIKGDGTGYHIPNTD